MIGLPPSVSGAEKEMVAWALPATAEVEVGASGTVIGVAGFDATDDELIPTSLVAVTVNVYVSPFVSPVTVIGLPVPVAVYVSVMSVTV